MLHQNAAAATELGPDVLSAAPVSLRDVRVLVVEDEIIVAIDLQDLLEEAGAIVVGPASNLATAIKLVKNHDIDCAILDVQLGGDTVQPVAALLEDKGVPFVFHTGNAMVEDLHIMWPQSRVLPKPTQHQRVLVTLSELSRLR